MSDPLKHLFLEGHDAASWMEAKNTALEALKKQEQIIYWYGSEADEHSLRSYLSGSTNEELIHQLQDLECPNPIAIKKHRIAFLATGQGSQYPHMAKEAYDQIPVFARAFDDAINALNPHLPMPLQSIIFPDAEEEAPLLHQTHYTQPALFAVEYAFAKTWQSFGIDPDFCMGHSIGEFASAVIAEVMSLEDGARLICRRSELMQSLPTGKGGMAAMMIGNDEKVASWLQAAHKQGFSLDVAAYNGPKQTVLSGDLAAIDAILPLAKEAGVRGTPITVSHAFHSSHMDPILDDFEQTADTIAYHAPKKCQLISNLHGRLLDTAPTGGYWREHIRNAVQFHQGIDALFAKDVEVFIETGPHPVLIGMSKRCFQGDTQPLWLPSIQNKGHNLDTLFESLGQLFIAGQPICFYK